MMRINNQSYKHLQKARTAFYAFMLILLLNINPASAQSYTVDDIKVDVSAANAVEAREKAFEEAQIKGYKMLAERFLSESELESFETPDINTVSAHVKDYEVSNEKLSATRYAGTYKIRYSSRAFLTKKKSASSGSNGGAQDKARPQKGHILVLPFFEEAGYEMLWNPNPFMQAWVRARENNRAAPSIVPLGDTQDISAINNGQALRYDPQNIEMLKKRYRAGQAAILMALPEPMPDGSINVAVGIYQAKSYGPELSRQISVRSTPQESQAQFYDRVVAEVNNVFRSSWKRQTAVTQPSQQNLQQPLSGPINTMVAQLDFNTMRQWVDTKKTLERTYGVKALSVKSLSPRSATLTISYQGGIENLRAAMQRDGIGLNDPLTQYGQSSAGSIYKITPKN